MTTIDKSRYIQPSGPAVFGQNGWSEKVVIRRPRSGLAKYKGWLIATGIVLFIGFVQFYMDVLEKVCPVCFGR